MNESASEDEAKGLEALGEWIGRREHARDDITPGMVERLAATLDKAPPATTKGAPLPTGWHAIAFPRVARRSALGRDGHPALGDFLPPVPLPRRMFAGRRVSFEAPLLIGDEVTRTSEIAAITPKRGRSGQMVFVTVRHSIESPRGLAIVEEQDIVYREEAAEAGAGARQPTPASASLDATWCRRESADQVTLFRYSALTFNGHRIHYDHRYVTEVEGYPGLVVNGGLTTLYLMELLRDFAPRPLQRIATRNKHPLFASQHFHVCAEPHEGTDAVRLWVANAHGTLIIEGEGQLAS